MPYLELSKALSWTLWYENIDLAMKDISNKLMIFINGRKNGRESGFRTQGRREVEIGTRLLGNDKNNVIVDKVLSYF